MVLRRSTTRWTWLSAFRRFARSILTRMISIRGAGAECSRRPGRVLGSRNLTRLPVKRQEPEERRPRSSRPRERVADGSFRPLIGAPPPARERERPAAPPPQSWIRRFRSSISCFKSLVGGRKLLDFPHGVQHGRMVAPAEPLAYFRERIAASWSWPGTSQSGAAARWRACGAPKEGRASTHCSGSATTFWMSSMRMRRGSRMPTRSAIAISAMSIVIGASENSARQTSRFSAPSRSRPLVATDLRHVVEHRVGDDEARVALARRAEPVLQDAPAHGEVGRGDADHDAALHARAHPLVDPLELGGRTVGGHHHLLAAVEQRFSMWQNSCCTALAGQELHVVDQQRCRSTAAAP